MAIDNDTYRRVAAAKMFIDDNLHERIKLEQVSQQACFSPFYFHKLFTRIYKKTPHAYMTQVRIEAAKRMLGQKTSSVSQVCTNVGFESVGSFSNLFKKKNGLGPQEYRQQQLQRQEAMETRPRTFIPSCVAHYYLGEEQQDSINSQ